MDTKMNGEKANRTEIYKKILKHLKKAQVTLKTESKFLKFILFA